MNTDPTKRFRPLPVDQAGGLLIVLGVMLPLLAILSPWGALRAPAAAGVVLVLPGLALVRLMRLADPLLRTLVSVTGSLAATVSTSSALMYAGLWSWQLALGVLGAATAGLALLLPAGGGSR